MSASVPPDDGVPPEHGGALPDPDSPRHDDVPDLSDDAPACSDDTPAFPDDDTPPTRDNFARQVIQTVRHRFPLVKIARAQQPFSLRLNGHVASLENLYRTVLLDPATATRRVERWAVELLRASEGTPDQQAEFADVRDRVLPVLVGRAGEDGPPSGGAGDLLTQPLIGELHVGYVIDGDRTVAYIPRVAPRRWGVSLDELHKVALKNLIARSESMNARAAQDEDGRVNLILFQTLDGYDASRLLLPTLHTRLREHLGSPFLAAVPNRDILLCFRDEDGTREALRKQISIDFQTMPHQISEKLILVTADGLAPAD